MKKICYRKREILLVILCLNILTGCALGQNTKEHVFEDTEIFHTYSYRDLKKLDEVTIYGESILFVLDEDQALPYRWNYRIEGEDIYVNRDYVVDEPHLNLPNLAVGSSPAFRVFEVQCEQKAKGTIYLECKHLYSDDLCAERQYEITYEAGKVTVQ